MHCHYICLEGKAWAGDLGGIWHIITTFPGKLLSFCFLPFAFLTGLLACWCYLSNASSKDFCSLLEREFWPMLRSTVERFHSKWTVLRHMIQSHNCEPSSMMRSTKSSRINHFSLYIFNRLKFHLYELHLLCYSLTVLCCWHMISIQILMLPFRERSSGRRMGFGFCLCLC